MNSNLLELPGFPAFTWSQDALNPLLLILKSKQEKILGKMDSLLPEYRNEANKEVLVSEIYSTLLSIGWSADPQKIRDLVANKLNNNLNRYTPEIDKSLYSFTNLILENMENYKLELTKERLIHWQEVIGQFSPPHSNGSTPYIIEELEKHLDRFLIWFNKPGLDRLMKAAIAHLWFQTINPFKENGGILAGFISNIQFAKADGTKFRYYSLPIQFIQEQSHYQFILAQTQNGSLDITIWLQWFLGCLERAYDHSTIMLSEIFIKANYWNHKMGIEFNKRQKIIIQKLLEKKELKLTTTIYAQLVYCGRDTALRDVTDLMKKQILSKEGGLGKNTRYKLIH